MHASSMCISCILSKQEKLIRQCSDESKKSDYMHQVLEILYKYGQTESAPWISEQIDHLYGEFWGESEDYIAVKQKYNKLLLDKEHEIWQYMQTSIKDCIKYVCAANYIDFSAVTDVSEETFDRLLEKARHETVPEEAYERFRIDLEHADKLVYLTDNCGEIVLDKLFIRRIKEEYPRLQITAIVRGKNVINDATLEDAKADMIISKGQGNFESLFGEGLNPYYLFLCKCELFVRRFGLEKYESVFAKEDEIRIE